MTRQNLRQTWDAANRLSQQTAPSSVSFTYDAAGQRASMTAGGVTTHYVGGRYEKNRTTAPQPVTEYYTLGPATIMRKWSSGSTFTDSYIFGDHLHSASLVTNKTFDVVQGRQHYWPYGSHRDAWTNLTDQDFTGQRLDVATATLDYGARRYDPYLNRWIQPDPIIPDPYNPQDLNRYAYCRNNPLKFVDPTGHWSEEALEASLGKDWRETYFGKDAVFGGRDKLLAFLTSDKTTSDFILGQVQSFFQGAGVLHGLGADLSSFDAMGLRISGTGGGVGFAALSGDAVLNLTAGEFSFFGSPEAGLLLGDSVQAVGGITLIKGLPSNNAYRGAFWAGGGLAGAYGSVTGEFFWGAPMSDRFNPTDTAHGGFVGAGAAVPELGVYGSLSYSLEVYREDVGGSHWYSPLPQLRQMIGDLQQVVWHDVEMNPMWPWSPYR
jgi:RHS repeat-associated protein